jgi:serine/threonine protein phosphatase PrpC
VRIEVGAATDIGKVREGNEDSFLVQPPLFAVADGMGGHRGGEVASQLALEVIETLAARGKGTLADQVREANRRVFDRSLKDRNVTGMGTTLTAALIGPGTATLAHVGDSRAYLLRAGALRRLTEDHTLVARMVKTGEITAAEAEVHPHRNVLTRALGTEPDVGVDELDVPLMDGDTVVLCSDGLTGMVNEQQMQAILEATDSPQDAADRLIKAANRAGGIDNITALVLRIFSDAAGSDLAGAGQGANSSQVSERPVRRLFGRALVWIPIALVLLAAGVFSARAYVDRQWYVGVADQHVAVFQGIPASPVGLHLSHVVFESNISSTDAAALPLYSNIGEGISAQGRDDAFAIVDQIRKDIVGAKAGGTGLGGSG